MKTEETIEALERLAALSLKEEEREAAGEDLMKMRSFFDTLNTLDTEGTEPLTDLFPRANVFREDVVTNGNGRDATLQNAPEAEGGGIVVPRTFSAGGAP